MSDVRNLVEVCDLSNEIYLGWGIIFAQFEETVVKESFTVFFWVELGVSATILVSSVVTKPDIVTCISKHVCQGRLSMDAPSVSI